eukprot:TRINITY_DN5198_c0_g1_i2.p1 TRINITY_DN5198_c0_g1~~TRINITY_DN5198_c0_g1_i2.p1  ORF type:complete len:576 (+),score=75.51 TRINITY_DN5198_c0_g1_i2:101-1828(+)
MSECGVEQGLQETNSQQTSNGEHVVSSEPHQAKVGSEDDIAACAQAAMCQLLENQRTLQVYLTSWLSEQENLVHRAMSSGNALHAVGCDELSKDGAEKTDVEAAARKMGAFEVKGEGVRHASVLQDHASKPLHIRRSRASESIIDYGDLGISGSRLLAPGVFQEGDMRLAMRQIETSSVFESVCAGVILANALYMAVDADLTMRTTLGVANYQAHEFVEWTFTFFYAAELALRIFVHRGMFFCGSGRRWNLFDTALVLTALQEHLSSLIAVSSMSSNLSYLRVLRLLKLLKLLRVIRLLRAFRQLRLVLNSLLGAMQSMVWSVVLCVTVIFLFATTFVQALSQHLSTNAFDQTDIDVIELRWSSVLVAMSTLWMAVTGGVDWAELISPLEVAGVHYHIFFILYVGLFLFVVSNSITSLFLDSALQYAEKDHHQVIQDQLRRKREYMNKVMTIYAEMDADGSGDVTYEEFCTHMSHPHMMAFAASLDIDTSDLQQFFSILSNNGTTAVDMETFVVGCIRLRGSARSMDVIALSLSQKSAASEHKDFVRFCKNEFARLAICDRSRTFFSERLYFVHK